MRVAGDTTRTVTATVVSMLVLAGVVALLVKGGGSNAATTEAGLLPKGQIYSALLAVGKDPETILLGTAKGAFASTDGGRTWRRDGLNDMLVMNLATGRNNIVWAAGHELLARSDNDGRTWYNLRSPAGLPHLDIHGFAVDPNDNEKLWAGLAASEAGLYRSTDGGRHFSYVSAIGAAPLALTVTTHSAVIEADGHRGLLGTLDEAKSWKLVIDAYGVDVAASPEAAGRFLLSIRDGALLLTTDGGVSWRKVLSPRGGIGPVTWSQAEPETAFAAGLDRRLYRSVDGGESWHPVG